jgi:ABC-type multidrug transport system permease subunit
VFLENENTEMVQYFEEYAGIEKVKTKEELTERVNKRDDIFGILSDEDGNYILAQGNEQEGTVEFARILKTYYEMGVDIEDSNAEIIDFGKTVSPMKKMFVNIAILLNTVLGGMIIGLNIVEEKSDNTISAINITPVSKLQFILGKSMIGLIMPIFGSIVILLLTGYTDINFGQVILTVIASSFISMLIGFIQGLTSDDVMSAAAGIKVLFLPMMAGVAAKEFLSEAWQRLFYWVPFYWTYTANDEILSYTSTWMNIFIYSMIVIGISVIVYFILAPKIRKRLE